MKRIIIAGSCLWLLLAGQAALGQARLVLNGARMRISGGAALVVQNASAQALTRYDGHIISEGQHNRIKWVSGTTPGLYTIPWGLPSGAYLPVSFTKEAGSGEGFFLLSTYGTSWRNSDALPGGVTHFSGSSGDQSARAVDRFWQISAQGYTEIPALANLRFTYLDEEMVAPNTISEEGLQALRWNEQARTWSGGAAAGTVQVADNTLVVPEVASADLFAWWTLNDASFTSLPLRGLWFEARLQRGNVHLHWTTLSEEQNEVFTIERSAGASFTAIGTLPGKGTTTAPSNYQYVDPAVAEGVYFYRLKQTDAGGKSSYSFVRRVEVRTRGKSSLAVYPNPARGATTLYATGIPQAVPVQVVDNSGRVVSQQVLVLGEVSGAKLNLSACRPGLYFVRILGAEQHTTRSIWVF